MFYGLVDAPSPRKPKQHQEKLKPIRDMLHEIWPLPVQLQIKERDLAKAVKAHHATSMENLDKLKRKDKFYEPALVGPKLKPDTPKKPRGRQAVKHYQLPTTQPIVRPKHDSICVLCLETTKTSVLSGHYTKKENFNWVVCRGCKSYMHYTCIKNAFRCHCGVAHLLGNTPMM